MMGKCGEKKSKILLWDNEDLWIAIVTLFHRVVNLLTTVDWVIVEWVSLTCCICVRTLPDCLLQFLRCRRDSTEMNEAIWFANEMTRFLPTFTLIPLLITYINICLRDIIESKLYLKAKQFLHIIICKLG